MISNKFSLRTSKAGACFIVASAVMGAVLMQGCSTLYTDRGGESDVPQPCDEVTHVELARVPEPSNV